MGAFDPAAQAAERPVTQRGLDAVRDLLVLIGEDHGREGLQDTPARVIRAWLELTAGYEQDPAKILATTFAERADEMVLVRDVPFASVCEHHMLPFHGTVTVGYLPRDRVVGLSKIPRLIECFARRLQVQERMTTQIADAMMEHLQPLGVGVLVTGYHSCMAMRGVQKHGEMVTSSLLGKFRDEARAEFLSLAK